MDLTRRQFLQTAGVAAATLRLGNLELALAAPGEDGTPPLGAIPTYRGWEDVLRQKWTWDKITKSTHIRTNCIAACSWNLFVKDGIVWREEQNALYEPSHPSVPDMNPRGCQKGGCYSQLMYEPSRLKYPLRRIG